MREAPPTGAPEAGPPAAEPDPPPAPLAPPPQGPAGPPAQPEPWPGAEQPTEGFELPASFTGGAPQPPDDQAPRAEQRLAPPPSRRARSRRGAGALAGGQRGRRPGRRRLFALLALAGAIVAAAVLALLSLSSGTKKTVVALPAVINVLIPEGENRLQIAEIARAKGLTGDYRQVSEHSPLLDPASYGAPHGTPDLEGFLFPATYELDKGAPALRLVEDQLAAFTEHFGPPQVAAAKALHVTPYQLLTVASMVEREALVPGDRAKIAAVIYNRLARGIPLGIDASIYYAVELQLNIPTYTHELTESQLHIDSPYNTRLHAGLPPTPISNPGAASIEAAAHPARVSYLYYVAGADGCGEQVFSNDQAEFEADVAAYRAAVEKNGGHPPVCKHH